MGSGSFARAYLRTGRPVLDDIVQLAKSIGDQNRREEWLKNIQSVRNKYLGDLNQIENATEALNTLVPNPNYRPYSEPKPQIPNFNPLVPNAGVVPTPIPQNTEMVTAPIFNKTTNVPLSEVQKYNRAKKLENNTIWDLIGGQSSGHTGHTAMGTEGTDPNVLNAFLRQVQQGTEQFRPSSRFELEDPTKRLVEIDAAGKRKVIDEGIMKRNSRVLDERLNDKGEKIVEYEDETGERWTENKGTDYKFIADQKRQAALDARLAKAIESENEKAPMDISKELTELEKNWNNLETLRKMPDDQKDKDGYTIKDKRRILFGNIKAQTDGLANQINSKYPGFEEIYNLLFLNPGMKAGKVNDVVEETMKGAPQEAKNWMKKILNKRIF